MAVAAWNAGFSRHSGPQGRGRFVATRAHWRAQPSHPGEWVRLAARLRRAVPAEAGVPNPISGQPRQSEEGFLLPLAERLSGQHLPERRAQLVAVAGSAAGDPDVVRLGMGVHDQFPVGALLVLADARLDQRRPLEPREPVLHVLARLADALRRGRPVAVGGVEVGPAPVVRDLEAPEAGRRDAVERALDPGRKLLLGQVGAARRRTEVEDLLPGGADERRVELREELREPGPAGEHEHVGLDGAAVREADLPHPAAVHPARRRLRPPEAAACLLELPEHPLAAAAGEQVAGVPFEHAVGEALRVDLGEAARQLVAVEFLDREAEFPEDRHRGLRVLVLPAPHPQHADGKEQPVVPARLVLLPDLVRPRHHRAVDPPRPVGGPDQPALAPRARAGVARPPGVHERHLGARAAEPERRPAAEGAGPDHGRADAVSGLRRARGGWPLVPRFRRRRSRRRRTRRRRRVRR